MAFLAGRIIWEFGYRRSKAEKKYRRIRTVYTIAYTGHAQGQNCPYIVQRIVGPVPSHIELLLRFGGEALGPGARLSGSFQRYPDLTCRSRNLALSPSTGAGQLRLHGGDRGQSQPAEQ